MVNNFNFNKNFKAQVDKFTVDTEEKFLIVIKDSIQDLVKEATKSEEYGGKMHVDTGFLRSTGTGAINQIPRGPDQGRKRNPGETGVIYHSDPVGSIQGLLPKLKIGDTFYYGWTAHYASIREMYDNFLKSASQKWSYFIRKNGRKFFKSGYKKWSQSVDKRI